MDDQRRIAHEAVVAQRTQERIRLARKLRIEKEIRQREERIARRKAANAAQESSKSSLTTR